MEDNVRRSLDEKNSGVLASAINQNLGCFRLVVEFEERVNVDVSRYEVTDILVFLWMRVLFPIRPEISRSALSTPDLVA